MINSRSADRISPAAKDIRILLTCVGRRVELVQAFRAAAAKLGINLILYGADRSDTAPALYFCDRQINVCAISDPDYIPELLGICQREHIDALIPTIDTDLLTLSRAKGRFQAVGTRAVVSDEPQVRICRDKRLTADFFVSCGLQTPVPVDDRKKYAAGFPCFLKPLDGSSSINALRIDNPDELEMFARRVADYIIQPFIDGMEYTVDIFCDFDGNPICITPRERIAVRSGEVLKTRIRQDMAIIDECRLIASRFKPCGAMTVQLILQKDTGDHYYIEINPRFGGGAPLSIKAGADSAEALIRLLTGGNPGYAGQAARDKAVYSRFDQSICVDEKAAAVSGREVKAVIFDLDDTLYAEKDYIRSGFRAVAAAVPQVGGIEAKLWSAFENRKPAIDEVLGSEGLYTDELKAACLLAYRLQEPEISLFEGVASLLVRLRTGGIKTGIITDGRPEGQKAKIRALGLEQLIDEIIITDEIGGAQFRKPNDIAFRIMQGRLGISFSEMVYVGDNPAKDFAAPEMLGMQSIFFDNKDGLYSNLSAAPPGIRTITAIAELAGELLGCRQDR